MYKEKPMDVPSIHKGKGIEFLPTSDDRARYIYIDGEYVATLKWHHGDFLIEFRTNSDPLLYVSTKFFSAVLAEQQRILDTIHAKAQAGRH
jgi:hypothetical protein